MALPIDAMRARTEGGASCGIRASNLAWLAATIWILVFALAPSVARGADCPERFRIVFADGTRSCLTDYPLAREDPTGQFSSLRTTIPSHGYFAVAATPADPQCKRAVGLGSLPGSNPLPQLVTELGHRTQKALQDCRLKVIGAAARCACKLVLVDGRSPMQAAEFARYADAQAGAAARANADAATAATAAAATATAAASAPTSRPVESAGAASPAAGAVAGGDASSATSADILALRRQIESLRTEMSRARPAAPAAKVQRARALVIGNSRYTHLGPLPNPRRDAEAIAAKLRSFGIEVDLHLDTDRSALVRALADFQDRAVGHDVNILFYAGHGLQIGGVNFIVPVDMQGENASVGSVKLTGISLDDALEYLPAQTRVVFLDACRDNPFSRSLRATRSGAGTGLAPMSTVSGTLLSYATRDGSTAEDGRGENSPYTTALLRHLGAEEDIALVLRRVRQSVLEMTGQRQEPWEYGSLVGDQLILSRMAR